VNKSLVQIRNYVTNVPIQNLYFLFLKYEQNSIPKLASITAIRIPAYEFHCLGSFTNSNLVDIQKKALDLGMYLKYKIKEHD